jgi:hypothetical protein
LGLPAQFRCKKAGHLRQKTVFAGFNDFTAYLESASVESAGTPLHEF